MHSPVHFLHQYFSGMNHLRFATTQVFLDRDNPKKVISRLPYPLFSPSLKWEKKGIVDNVVFPTGTTIEGDNLNIYYGAADYYIGLKIFSLSKLLAELSKYGP